jgi:quinol-cytochrome oxidoreductase complex cytochrome b subunit
MSFTAITVVLMGILTAYAVVTGILYAFAYTSRRRPRATAAVLVPSQSQASGD